MAILSLLQRAAWSWHRAVGDRRLETTRGKAVREISTFPLHVQRDLLTDGKKRIHHH